MLFSEMLTYSSTTNLISLICRLQVEIEKLSKERLHFQNKLDKNSIFQKYMERVQESTDEFGEIREIIGRHDTLVATHQVSDNQLLCFKGSFMSPSMIKYVLKFSRG